MSLSLQGKMCGKYLLEAKIGQGSIGVLYDAQDTFTHQQVILHIIDKRIQGNAVVMSALSSMVETLSRISHPNVATIIGLEKGEEMSAIVMEKSVGVPITEGIHGVVRSEQELLRVLNGVLSGLHAFHQEGLAHLALKPSNIHLAADRGVKLHNVNMDRFQQDAGITMMLRKDDDLMYEAPEQIKGKREVSHLTDIYAAGMLLYELAAGRPEFASSHDDFLIRKTIVDGEIPPPEKTNPRVSKTIARVIARATERDPSRRYQSALEMLGSLQDAVRGGDTIPAMQSPIPTYRSRDQRKYLTLGIVVAVAVVLGIALVVFLAR